MMKWHKVLSKVIISLSFLMISKSGFAQTEEEVFIPKNTVDQVEEPRRTHFAVDTGMISLSNDNADIVGMVVKLEAKYGFNTKWAASFFGAQSYDVSALTSIFTSVGVGGSYAITGSQIRDQTSISMNDSNVVTQTEWIKPALIGGLNVKQVFFNGSTRAVPLSGIGGQINYFFGSNSNWAFRIGAGFDFLSNGVEVLTPVQVLGGINYWL